MLFTRLALVALPLFSGVFALPVAITEKQSLSLEKRGTVLDIVNDFASSVAAPIAAIKAGNADGSLTASDATKHLTEIDGAIKSAVGSLSGAAIKRSLIPRQGTVDDLNTVGTVLAKVITDLVEAISGIVDELKFLPLIGALIISIDSGLNTILLAVELLLAGVVDLLRGLLTGVSGLLASLGAGLLAGLLFNF